MYVQICDIEEFLGKIVMKNVLVMGHIILNYPTLGAVIAQSV
jgi:hypothetical protein